MKENAIKTLSRVVIKFTSPIVAVLSGLDRVILKGNLLITNGPALEGCVDHVLKIRRWDFMAFAEEQSRTLINHARRLAGQAGAGYRFLQGYRRKDNMVEEILRQSFHPRRGNPIETRTQPPTPEAGLFREDHAASSRKKYAADIAAYRYRWRDYPGRTKITDTRRPGPDAGMSTVNLLLEMTREQRPRLLAHAAARRSRTRSTAGSTSCPNRNQRWAGAVRGQGYRVDALDAGIEACHATQSRIAKSRQPV